MAANKIQTGLRLNETIYEKLRVLSSRETRSLNNLIEYVLQRYVNEYEAEHGTIQIPDTDKE